MGQNRHKTDTKPTQRRHSADTAPTLAYATRQGATDVETDTKPTQNRHKTDIARPTGGN